MDNYDLRYQAIELAVRFAETYTAAHPEWSWEDIDGKILDLTEKIYQFLIKEK